MPLWYQWSVFNQPVATQLYVRFVGLKYFCECHSVTEHWNKGKYMDIFQPRVKTGHAISHGLAPIWSNGICNLDEVVDLSVRMEFHPNTMLYARSLVWTTQQKFRLHVLCCLLYIHVYLPGCSRVSFYSAERYCILCYFCIAIYETTVDLGC